ncbi:MAG TPA: S8 family serine peptidase [Acidimicrobiales bacterium]|nr:S8 family serine peptidase [Acidimicrobiales bacterium]
MAKATETEQYVVLPPRGLRAGTSAGDAQAREVLVGAESVTGGRLSIDGSQVPVKVIDSIASNGAKLVELSPASALALRFLRPGLRVVPVVYYTPAVAPIPQVESRPVTTTSGRTAAGDTITMKVVSKKDKSPVVGAIVVAFVDFAGRTGAQGVTDGAGQVSLALGAASVQLQRLYIYPVDGYWSLIKKNVTVSSASVLTLAPLDLAYTDGVRYFYPSSPDDAGAGVTVGVVDTGVAAHPDLVIAGGANTVPGEDPTDFGDNGVHHGTHVAGIIAARGTPPTGIRGVAPGVSLRAYRVFGQGSGSASSFAIAKAIDQAVTDKCDLINMSLGGGQADPVLTAAVEDARAAGSLCIIAAGNDGRKPVSFPAYDDRALAVSAMGRKGTFPTSATEAGDVAAPYGTDKKNFLADFSNVGPQLDLVGPGVGIMSTVPGGYEEISGTSMACPAVTGAAARSLTPKILKMKRAAARSDAMVTAVVATAKPLGFGPTFEGHGVPRPD